jgi:regulator of sigma E protease
VHEAGHFIAARKSGILVEEFAMGMGPVLVSKKRGDTLYSLRLLPIGGFCKMLGEDGESGDSEEKDERAFCNKSVFRRVLVLSAGALMNFALAIIVLFFLHILSGATIPVVSAVTDGYPGQIAGLMPGDRIIKLNGANILTYDDFSFAFASITDKDSPITLTVRRGNETIPLYTATRYIEDEDRYVIGFHPSFKEGLLQDSGGARLGVFEAAGLSFCKPVFWFKATVVTLARLIQEGFSLDNLNSIIGLNAFIGTTYEEAVTAGEEAVTAGAKSSVIIWNVILTMAGFLAFLSANVGVINLLPFPALDGGRLMFVFAEGITKKRVAPEKEAVIHFVGFVVLMALFAVIAVNDYLVFYVK